MDKQDEENMVLICATGYLGMWYYTDEQWEEFAELHPEYKEGIMSEIEDVKRDVAIKAAQRVGY